MATSSSNVNFCPVSGSTVRNKIDKIVFPGMNDSFSRHLDIAPLENLGQPKHSIVVQCLCAFVSELFNLFWDWQDVENVRHPRNRKEQDVRERLRRSGDTRFMILNPWWIALTKKCSCPLLNAPKSTPNVNAPATCNQRFSLSEIRQKPNCGTIG